MKNTRSLRLAALLTLVLFLATGVGVSVHHHADHGAEGTHVTAGDHGHGATLLVRDMRTKRPGTAVYVPATSTAAVLRQPAEPERRISTQEPSTPRGRSPPASCRPRAPPPTS